MKRLLLAFFAVLLLVGCGGNKDKFIGSWSTTSEAFKDVPSDSSIGKHLKKRECKVTIYSSGSATVTMAGESPRFGNWESFAWTPFTDNDTITIEFSNADTYTFKITGSNRAGMRGETFYRDRKEG